MNVKKHGLFVVMVFIMVVGIRKSAYGMEMKVETPMSNGYELITPLWVSTHEVSPNILAKGTTVYSEAYVRAKRTSGVISGRMYIEKFTSGTWIRVASWQLSGTGNTFLSKSYHGAASCIYRTKVEVNIDGEFVEVTSRSCTT